jgi:predicted transcriptional regulator/DNA-binding XRE family transcriptional regulator
MADNRTAERKVFAGPRIKRLRRDMGLTQARMAEELSISASYLNLIERNQRPLSAQLLLRLAEVYDVDLRSLSGDDEIRAAASMKEVFSDPLFDGVVPGNQELADLAATSPMAVDAVIRLYRAYQEAAGNATTLAGQLTERDGPVSLERLRLPVEQVRDFLQAEANHFPELENAAEALWEDALEDVEDTALGLRDHLSAAHGVSVRVVPQSVIPGMLRKFDRHSRRLFLSEMMETPARSFQLSFQTGMLANRELIDSIVRRAGMQGAEAERLCRISLGNYLAAALLMPYERFQTAANELRYDLETLAQRFGASFEQVCHRVTTLQRQGSRGVPLFFLRVDRAGNISKRFAGAGFPFARFGGTCPRWNIHDAFYVPGRIVTQVVEMPDGDSYFSVSRTVSGARTEHHAQRQVYTVSIGCELKHARRLVYADGIDLENPQVATPIGANCRLCEREDCNQRALPPLNRRLAVSEYQRGLSPFAFARD